MRHQRQLAAIMFTDIEGYTSLMQHDEMQAIAIRERHRNSFEVTTEAYGGKIIQYFGDGTLSIFKSTVEAVYCAIEMQKAFLEDPKIPVRIGIHVGDIMYSDEDIIGDAVNVASRIESCAVPGSVLISDKVHDQIRSHRDIHVKFLDAFELKNVDDAMPIFAISNEGLIVPKREEVKGKLKVVKENPKSFIGFFKNKKNIFRLTAVAILLFFLFNIKSLKITTDTSEKELSIAVLPFNNLSSDKDSDFFRDGVTEDILTQLSKLKDVRVISRTSVMQYKGTNKTMPTIANELGVSYVLDGSIRKYGNDIRISAQLIDADLDRNLWAENYDKTITDVFTIQTEISQEIVMALELNLSFEEQKRLTTVATKNINAYKLFIEGRDEADKRNSESIAKSIALYKEATILDPNYAEAYAEIANSIYLETYYSRRDPAEASKSAREYLVKAEVINSEVPRIYSVKGFIDNIEGNHQAAEDAFQKAISLSPNDLTTRHQYATFYYYTRQYVKQLEQAEIAYRLDPLSFVTANSYATALAFNHKYDEAERILKKAENLSSENNKFVINRSYFRLYMDQKRYKEAINPLKKIVIEENVFNRFLGFCYAKIGDTVNAKKTIHTIRRVAHPYEKSQQLAVVYAGLQERDSVLYYLDTIRNKQTKTLKREVSEFFEFLKDDDEFKEVLMSHGILEE
ncbi:adenylate/guanylate cyclase domain-containing protein [uncultured Algibacter sp.]|uniref:adenylate/guanylate cyclase domain-containing protein n=1 Tax=uncultured Algibacter sp. TaxID=298659 RepID=UPI00262524A4|nr:adenylate/guanylate cyclase domain-containing protein [uncultured Algibacter sp.]